MISNASQLTSSLSNLSVTSGFSGLGFAFPGVEAQSMASGLGVSTSAAPLISAPASRQTSEFQALIAPPTRPANPSIAAPKAGNEGNVMGASGASMSSPAAEMADFAAIRLQMASGQGNGPSGDRNQILSTVGKGFGR